jgi:hypothetical protein
MPSFALRRARTPCKGVNSPEKDVLQASRENEVSLASHACFSSSIDMIQRNRLDSDRCQPGAKML